MSLNVIGWVILLAGLGIGLFGHNAAYKMFAAIFVIVGVAMIMKVRDKVRGN